MKLLKNKKNENTEEIQKQSKQNTAQQWNPIADIDNDIVYRKDSKFVGIIRVQPENLHLLSNREKKRKADILAEQLNGEKQDIQIFCIGRPVDLNNYLDWKQELYKNEQNFIKKQILKGFINQAAIMATSGETIERRFYFILVDKSEKDLISKLYEFSSKISDAELVNSICKTDEILDVYSLFANPIQASFERVEIDYSITSFIE